MSGTHVLYGKQNIMAVAKGIASGFLLNTTVASKKLMKNWYVGSHGTTFGGNPVACAPALAMMEVIKEENILETVE